MKKVLLVCLSGLFLLSGCSSSDAPSCSSSDVEKLVIEIVQGELQKSYANSMKYIGNERYQKLTQELEANNKMNNIESMGQVMDLVNELGAEWVEDLELSSIRTSEVDEKLLKSTCEGNINLNDNSLNITYDAQTTDNGDLYVNVYGL